MNPKTASGPREASHTPSASVLEGLLAGSGIRPREHTSTVRYKHVGYVRNWLASMEAPEYGSEQGALFRQRLPWTQGLPGLASISCAAGFSVWVDGASEPLAWVAAMASLAVGLIAVRRTTRVARALGWGAAMVLASLGPFGESRFLSVCGIVGAWTCVAAAIAAIASMPLPGGIVRVAPSSTAVAVAAVSTFWCAAVAARIVPLSGTLDWMTGYPSLWSVGAAAASMLVLVAQMERTFRRRCLELGVVERVLAMRALLGTSFATVLLIGTLGGSQPDDVARSVVALGSVVVGGAALHADAVGVARVTRRIVVLTIVGGCVALLGASAVASGGRGAWGIVLVTAAVAVTVGAAAPALERPLRPEGGKWLDAFANACAETSRAQPEDVIREVLRALRAPGGLSSPSPELWTFVPPTATKVDAAGYLHDRDVEVPEALVFTAAREPEGTLCADVLDLLEVRRPDLRPFSKWMAERGALLVTVVAYDGEAEGLLVLPRVARLQPPTLEEVHALKHVADRLAGACRARAARARMLSRANHANEQAEAAHEREERLMHERALDMGRDALAATRLARPATVGGYAAGSRMALEALERRAAVSAPIAVVAASGVDPVPYLARAHLAGARRAAPLVLVDATSAREHDVARWSDRRVSPLALANRGMLVLLDGAALPADVQQLVASSLAEKRAPWDRPEGLDVQLAFTAVLRPDQLVSDGRLDPSLALGLADARSSPVVLPRLRDRTEDLRAIITDRLAREGLRVLGRPVGIEQAAYAQLVEHLFPGEDAELGVIVQRLVVRCSGDVVRAADVDALRLFSGQPLTAHPGPSGRRKSPLSA
jgi:hypothetical protein